MSDATNRLAKKLHQLALRARAALRLKDEGVALRRLASIETERCLIMKSVAAQNVELLGLTPETMKLIMADLGE